MLGHSGTAQKVPETDAELTDFHKTVLIATLLVSSDLQRFPAADSQAFGGFLTIVLHKQKFGRNISRVKTLYGEYWLF